MRKRNRKNPRSTKPTVSKFDELGDVAEFEMLHARAAVMTAVLALEGKGVYTHIAILLRGTDRRLSDVQQTLQRLRGSPIVDHLVA